MKLKLPNWGSLCNPNLLLNSDFRYSVINQKGQNKYNSVSRLYGADGWYVLENSTLEVYGNYIKITLPNTLSEVGQLTDEWVNRLDSLTFALKLRNNNTIYKVTFENISSTMPNTGNKMSKSIYGNISVNLFSYAGKLSVFLTATTNTTIEIEFTKLEKGKYFTGMPCWNYAMELLKCQNKFEVKSIACFAIGGTFQQFHATESASYFFCGDYTWIEKDKIPTVEVKEISTNEGVISDISVAATSITKNGCSGFRSNIPIGRPYLLLKCWIDAYNYG